MIKKIVKTACQKAVRVGHKRKQYFSNTQNSIDSEAVEAECQKSGQRSRLMKEGMKKRIVVMHS